VASEGKRTLGAIVVVAVALLLVGRYVIRSDRADAPTEPESASALASTSPPPTPSASGTPAKRHARYESALVDASIRGLSSGAGTALAVGDRGAIFERTLEDAKWMKMTAPTSATLRAVAQRLDEAVAVGDDGTILELEDGAWKLAASGTKRALRAVAYTSYGVVAVGDGGTLLRRPALHSAWQADASGTSSDLFGACAGLRDAWIVGRAGTILGRVGDAWKLQPPPTTASLYAIACDDHAAVAVGEKGAMVERLDDVGWHESPSGVTVDLLAVAAPLGTRSFTVVGAAGTVVHVAGEPASEAQSVSFDWRAITEGPLGTWLGAEGGVFRRAPM
jgi:hypothetical protein